MNFPAGHDEAELRARLSDAIAAGGGVKRMAEKTGIPKGTLEKYAAQTSTASFPNVVRIAEAVGRSVDQIAHAQDRQSKFGVTAQRPVDLDIERLELAIRTVERGLDEADRVATPEGQAGMIAAAYELLTIPNDSSVGRILRLVKG